MRKAGLLKPKPGDGDQNDVVAADEPDTPETSDDSPSGPARTTIDEPEEEPSYEESDDLTGSSEDDEAKLGETAETEPPAPVGAETPAKDQPDESPQSQASPERTSVFDRFSNSADESRAVVGVDESSDEPTELAAPAAHPDDDDDEDYAGALRARLRSEPPTQDRMVDEDVDDEPEPSRWKTILLFLILIIVGFGVGIFLGSLIFAGGDTAAEPSITHYVYPGAL